MAFRKKWFRWRAVKNDEGYEVVFTEKFIRGQKVKYSGPKRALTVVAESVMVGPNRKWGLHFALLDQYLQNWDDGTVTTAAERDAIRARLIEALKFMGVLHSVDLPNKFFASS